MKITESGNIDDKRHYDPPKLIRQGHVSRVTKKSTPTTDVDFYTSTAGNETAGQAESSDGSGSGGIFEDNVFDTDSGGGSRGSSEDVFDNFFDE